MKPFIVITLLIVLLWLLSISFRSSNGYIIVRKGSLIEGSNPGVYGKVAGSFSDPRTGQTIVVLTKKDEDSAHAMARVRSHHGL